MKKKILLIANYKPGTGGISGQVEKIQYYLNVEHIENAVFSVKGSVWYRLALPLKLFTVGRHYDVFHIHTCSYGGFLSAVIGVSIGKILRKRIILTYHGGGGELFFNNHHRFVRFFLLKTDANIVLSGFLGKVFHTYNIPCVQIPNVIEIDNSLFVDRPLLKPNYVSVRSLEPLYNIECILKAFQIVKRKLSHSSLIVVGDGSQRKYLENFVVDNKISDVSFIGRVDNSQIYNYLKKADIMLSSPRIDNMPVSILEGFNAGLLVISSNVGGVPFMIDDGVNGLLFDSDDCHELANKMIAAVTEQDKSKQMIYNALNSLNYYSWNSIRTQLLPLYGI